jgi:hypothetical protein
MIDGIIIVTRKSDVLVYNQEEHKFHNTQRVYAIRKFNPDKTYKNMIKSLTRQIKDTYFDWPKLTPTKFEEWFNVDLYSFDRKGWPKLEGELRYFLQ